MKRAIIYARVSTESQEEGTSLDHQIQRLTDYAAQHGLEVVDTIEEVSSGADPDRDGLTQLRERAREYDVLLCWRVDRFMRDVLQGLVIADELRKMDVEIICLDAPPTGSEDTDQLLQMLHLWHGQRERKKIDERTYNGITDTLKQGRLMPTPRVLYGYEYWVERDNGGKRIDAELRINEGEAPIVREIFERYAAGSTSMSKLARDLQERGVPTRSGGKWYRSTISSILRNETYTGKRKYKRKRTGETITVEVPSIINSTIFDNASRRMERNKSTMGRNKKNDYLLGGMLRCICGRALSGITRYRKKCDTRYYICGSRRKSDGRGDPCGLPIIRADVLEEAVWDSVYGYLTDPEKVLEDYERKLNKRLEEQSHIHSRISSVQSVIDRCDRQLSSLLSDAITGSFRNAIINQKREEIERMRETALAELQKLETRVEHPITKEGIEEIIEWARQSYLKAENALLVLSDSALIIAYEYETIEHSIEDTKRKILERLEIIVKVTGSTTVEVSGNIPLAEIAYKLPR